MNDDPRPLAKLIPCPKTKKQLSKIVETELAAQTKYLCRVLIRAMRNSPVGRNLKVEGPKEFGAENFRNIYYENKLPCLKNLINLANKLNLKVEFKNYPFKHSFAIARRDWAFDEGFEHDKFVSFLKLLAANRPSEGDSPEMKKEREIILGKLSNPEFPVFWSTLIRYSAACGYQLNCYLNRKEKGGCLTPSPVVFKGDEKDSWSVDPTGKRDYEALIRRLNYPV